MVYFIKDEGSGHIKIGYTSGGVYGVKQRLSSLQTSSPTKLEVLAVIQGSRKTEKYLHEQFKDIRVIGEWFKPTVKLMAQILLLSKNQYNEQTKDDNYCGVENFRNRVVITIPNSIMTEIKLLAKAERRTVSNMVTFMLSEALQKLPLTTRLAAGQEVQG